MGMGRGIDLSFVLKWDPIYDDYNVGGDERDYQEIRKSVADELDETGVIKEETFRTIITWKAARLLGKKGWVGRHLERGQYGDLYLPKIREAARASEEESIFKLKANGIGPSVASTILHMINPNKYPIMDVRTVEVLNRRDYIKWKTRSRENYAEFTKTMRGLQTETGQPLRRIDRALFAYHKKMIGRKV